MNRTRWTVVVAWIAFALVSARSSAETGTGFNLNPFAKPPESKSVSNRFKLPSLWPTSDQKKTVRRPSEPSAWEKFTTETRSVFDKTTDTLMFWDKDRSSKSRAPDSVRSRYGVPTRQQEKKKPFWSGWFGQEEEPHRPRTVSEFLNQDKPQY